MVSHPFRLLIFAVASICILTALPVLTNAANSGDRVAVVVSSGDTGGALDESMKDLEKKAIQTYERLGFKVIVVGGANKKVSDLGADSLTRTLASLKGVKDLRLDFLGHGGIGPIPDGAKLGAASQKLPALNISTARRAQMDRDAREAISDKPAFWTALDLTSADSGSGGHYSSLFGEIPTAPKLITTDSIKDALRQFRNNNSSSTATVNLLNCYSGSVAQALRFEPDTLVFGNSPPTAPAIDLTQYTKGNPGGMFSSADTKYISSETGLSDYYDVLTGSAAPGSVGDARRKANNKFLLALSEEGDIQIMNVGRSPYYESIIGWCEENPRENRTQNFTKSEHQQAIVRSVKNELEEITSIFTKSSARPVMGTLSSQTMRKSAYQNCVRPPLQSPIPTRLGEPVHAMGWAVGLANPPNPKSKVDLNQEYGRLADFFLSQISAGDPKKVEESIMSSIQRTADELKDTPRENWGKFAELYDGIQSQKILKADLIVRLKQTLVSMKSDCRTGDVNKLPCDKYVVYWQDFNRFLPTSNLPKPKTNCAPLDYFCYYAKGTVPVEQGLYKFMEQLGPSGARHSEAKLTGKKLETKCQESAYGSYQRELGNFKLDEDCMKRFEQCAPSAEWSNLERLWKLGAQDARGLTNPSTSEINGSAQHEKVSQ